MRTARLLGAVLTAALLAGCARAQAAPGDLQGLTDAWRERASVPAVAVAVALPGEPPAVMVSGATERGGEEPLPPDARFRIGSITKTFVAVVVLQLVEEGRLRLDDPLSAYLPDLPWGEEVTVRHLLAHTSGLPDYGQARGLGERLLRDRDDRWSTADVLALVADRDVEFAPGAAYGYSNTNYVLLGQVVEAVSSSWADEVRRRIIGPLGLRDTFVAGSEAWSGRVVTGYFDVDRDGFTDSVGDGPWPALETSEGAAGAIVSTAADLARFGTALFDGELLSPAALESMVAVGVPYLRHSGYGLGVEVFRPDYETTVWGHGGSLPGYRSTLWFLPDYDVTIVVLTDEWRSNPADLAELILQRIRPVSVDEAKHRVGDADRLVGSLPLEGLRKATSAPLATSLASVGIDRIPDPGTDRNRAGGPDAVVSVVHHHVPALKGHDAVTKYRLQAPKAM